MSDIAVLIITSALGLSTLLVNSGLGWTKGKWWMWLIHAANAAAWQAYVVATGQWGLTVLNVVTIVVDIISAYRAYKRKDE